MEPDHTLERHVSIVHVQNSGATEAPTDRRETRTVDHASVSELLAPERRLCSAAFDFGSDLLYPGAHLILLVGNLAAPQISSANAL